MDPKLPLKELVKSPFLVFEPKTYFSIPKLSFNLLSLSQLTKSLNCSITWYTLFFLFKSVVQANLVKDMNMEDSIVLGLDR